MAARSLLQIKKACALVAAGDARGSGFLVLPDALLTCYHVVHNATGPLRVYFSDGDYAAQVARIDVENDLALLRLSAPPTTLEPLELATAVLPASTPWEADGFPAATYESGLLLTGKIVDSTGEDLRRRPALQLYCPQLTAGAYPQGLSGSPVLADGRVIGQLRQIVPDEQGGGQFATLYACPGTLLAKLIPETPPLGRNPYRGLSAFQKEDAALFCGREELTDELWQSYRCVVNSDVLRLLGILGPSGSGKSSLVRAGLIPMLTQQPLPGPGPPRVVILKPGQHPIEALALALLPLFRPGTTALELGAWRTLSHELAQPSHSGEYSGLRLLAAGLPGIAATPLLAIVDQFEEIYTLCADKDERDAFVALLLNAAGDRGRHVSVVLTMRSDFLDETQRHHLELNRALAAARGAVLVSGMNREELRRAITEPARLAGHPLDEASVELLLAETRDHSWALPLLEFALERVWEGLQQGQAPLATIKAAGGIGGALAKKAQTLYDGLGPAQQAIASRALVRLVHLGDGTRDTRRRVAVRDLCGRGDSEENVLAVLRNSSRRIFILHFRSAPTCSV